MQLLARVVWLAHERGSSIVNVDATVMLESPKVRPYVTSMRERNIAHVLAVDPLAVSVKARPRRNGCSWSWGSRGRAGCAFRSQRANQNSWSWRNCLRPQDVIRKKRDGLNLTGDEIEFFIDGVTKGTIADYQVSALLMAIFLNGMNETEQAHSHRPCCVLRFNSRFLRDRKPKADKHSTGGVGDKTSLLIAPMVAACVCVPMISGRGLGHTGGTLDKLESIPGYRVDLSASEFERVLIDVGYAMSGQTAELAPADKKMYALRDATSTVEAIPLIVASIISKKGAAGT